MVGELQAFLVWLEGREARSEVGRDREGLGALCPAGEFGHDPTGAGAP